MQPSPSLTAPVSSSSWSPGPFAAIVWPGGHSDAAPPPPPPAAPPPPWVTPPPPCVVLPPPLLVLPPEDELPAAEAGALACAAVSATPTPMRPFMPAAAWPATVQRYSYLPLFVSFTVSVALSPWCRIFVTLPTQAFFARLATGAVQSLKSWKATPWFVTLKVIVPTGRFENFDSLKASSVGLPAVTVITVVAARGAFTFAAAGPTAVSTSARTARQTPPRTKLNERLRCIDRDHSFRETQVADRQSHPPANPFRAQV